MSRRRPPEGQPDLLVVGAGVMGAWTAFWAQRAGMRVTLVDAWGAGHPRATSGDETRISRASHGADRLYTRWSRQARAHWIRFGEAWGERLFIECGALWFAAADDGFEAASLATLRDEGIPVDRLTTDEVAERWPQVDAQDLRFAAFEPEAGLLMARRGVAAVVRAFVAEGGRFELASVRPGRTSGAGLQDVVAQDGSRLGAGSFVFACGPWLPRLFPDLLGDLIRVTKQDVFFVGPAAGDGSFAAEWLPCFVDYDAAFYGIPAVDGRGLKLAPDRYGPVFDPTDGERLVDPDSLRLTRAYLRRRFPALAARPILETRVCQYEATPDEHWLIDRHPVWSNAWLVGGGSGHAFKHGPRIGEYVVSRLAGAPEGASDGPDEARFRLGERQAGGGVRTSPDQRRQSGDGVSR